MIANDLENALTPGDTDGRESAQIPGSENPAPAACETGPKGDGRKRSAIKHGLRIAKCNDTWSSIETDNRHLQTALRLAVIDVHGSGVIVEQLPLQNGGVQYKLVIGYEALIQSACRHEKRAALIERWLREKGEELPLADRLAMLANLSAATDARDKCLAKLGVDKPPKDSDPWRMLDALHAQAPENAATASGDGSTRESSEPSKVAPCMPGATVSPGDAA